MKTIIQFFLFQFFVIAGIAQQHEGLKIFESIGRRPIILNEWVAVGDDGDSIKITKLKYYISHFQIKNKGVVVRQNWPETKLADILNTPDSFSKAGGNFDQLEFFLGIDSMVQESGAQDGELDPLKGMYWTWQSGYIHFKLEGHIRLTDHTEHDITLHLGGYRFPYNTVQPVSLMSVQATSSWLVEFDLQELIQFISEKKLFRIMSPGQQAVELSAIIAHSFKINSQ